VRASRDDASPSPRRSSSICNGTIAPSRSQSGCFRRSAERSIAAVVARVVASTRDDEKDAPQKASHSAHRPHASTLDVAWKGALARLLDRNRAIGGMRVERSRRFFEGGRRFTELEIDGEHGFLVANLFIERARIFEDGPRGRIAKHHQCPRETNSGAGRCSDIAELVVESGGDLEALASAVRLGETQERLAEEHRCRRCCVGIAHAPEEEKPVMDRATSVFELAQRDLVDAHLREDEHDAGPATRWHGYRTGRIRSGLVVQSVLRAATKLPDFALQMLQASPALRHSRGGRGRRGDGRMQAKRARATHRPSDGRAPTALQGEFREKTDDALRRNGIRKPTVFAAVQRTVSTLLLTLPSMLLFVACGSPRSREPAHLNLRPNSNSEVECFSACVGMGRERAFCTDQCTAAERQRQATELSELEAGCLIWEDGRCVKKSAYADGGAPPPED
jgi:hypothetical protein